MATRTGHVATTATRCNCTAVRPAARQITQFYDRHLAPAGLRTTQYSILARLERLGSLSIGELAASVVMDRTTLARAIQPLKRDGLVAVGPGKDGRTRGIGLTSRGKSRLRAASIHWQGAQNEFESVFGAAASEGLGATMLRLIAVI